MNDRLTRMLAGEPTEDLQRNIKQYIEERYEVVKRLEWLNRELDTLMRELDRRDEIKRSQRAQTITWEQLTKDQQTILSYLMSGAQAGASDNFISQLMFKAMEASRLDPNLDVGKFVADKLAEGWAAIANHLR